MRSSDIYQIILILSGIIVAAFFGVFFYREIFPEYKIYQDDYIALENFRTTYAGGAPPAFKVGVKQIVLEREDKGAPVIDRCTSCHVALEIPYFSPTKIAHDINGNIVRDSKGHPILVANEDYIWNKLDQKINELRDPQVNEQLNQQGESQQIQARLKQAEEYESLKTAHVNGLMYDVSKVLAMHPLIGKETRPFEYHPIAEYGCTSCHNGNGRGLTTEKAHGPVFDGQYEAEFRGRVPQFTEPDPDNDPQFAHVFNAKPGPDLLFQTQPIFVGSLIEAKCMQCHQTSEDQLQRAAMTAVDITQKRIEHYKALQEDLKKDKETLASLLEIKKRVSNDGYNLTLNYLKQRQKDYTLPIQERTHNEAQLNFLQKAAQGGSEEEAQEKKQVLTQLDNQLSRLLGSSSLAQDLQKEYDQKGSSAIDPFLANYQKDEQAKGIIFIKQESLQYDKELLRHIQETQTSFESAIKDPKVIAALSADVDELTSHYRRGKELYLSQACYACHRIAGFTRGGVGPELTRIGDHYPWYIKESIVWPQADLPSSTMPNMRLDHQEIEDLMTFLLAQKGSNKAIAQTSYQEALQSWEAGRKLPWEKPIPPAQMYDLRYAMTVFAVEGCASCHRLQGFESNVGFKIEKESPSFDALYEEQEWFKKLFPETIRLGYYDQTLPGSHIVAQIEKHADEIDARIVSDVRQNSILEEIDQEHPQAIESLYSEFRYASRAKSHEYATLAKQEKDPAKRAEIEAKQRAWQDRVYRVLMMYIQQYGLGRLIGPHLNWSGIYRSDEWLMEHFRNPTSHVPRSIMPVFPFDDTKFYALTNMLDHLAIGNRNHTRAIWENRGFDPAEAFEIHCAQCHGINHEGHGAISEWLYPLPKSLRDADFMRNLTKDRAIYSITHGVKGTPMPPWGEVAGDKSSEVQKLSGNKPVLTNNEIHYLVNWLFSSLPGEEVIRSSTDVLKWQYQPQDVLNELRKEGGILKPLPNKEVKEREQKQSQPLEINLPPENNPPVEPQLSALFAINENYYAAIRPEIYPRQAPQGTQQVNTVEDVFDIFPNPAGPDPYLYYIKHNYYTPYNIQQGQKFFLLNCAVCHGNEGDGSGIRSQAMQNAKPRMLTNLDWIDSRDDLRLLRSIKYGVPGTSMIPWGDQTNALQRMQLVMFIRSLSREQEFRRLLDTRLYQAFNLAQITIDNARVQLTAELEKLKEEERRWLDKQVDLENQVTQGKIDPKSALETYQQSLEIARQIKRLQDRDQQLQDLKAQVEHERDTYQSLGLALISAGVSDLILSSYFELLTLNEGRYALDKGSLSIRKISEDKTHIHALRQSIVEEIDKKISELQKSKISSSQQEELKTIESEITVYQKLKGKVISDVEEALRSASRQEEMVEKLQSGTEKKMNNRMEEKSHDHIRR